MLPERNKRYEWKVLLIGGSSGVGKTMIARELSNIFSLPLLLVDDVRIALQQVTSRETNPELHVFLNYQREQWGQPKLILADWITLGKAMANPLQAIIGHHIISTDAGAILIEGDGVLPMTSSRFLETKDVCTVFIIEEEEKQLLHNLRSRGRGFNDWDELEQQSFAHASWLYGQWLMQEAKSAGLPVINARPQGTLVERLLSVVAVA